MQLYWSLVKHIVCLRNNNFYEIFFFFSFSQNFTTDSIAPKVEYILKDERINLKIATSDNFVLHNKLQENEI